VVSRFADRLKRGEAVVVFGDGEQVRDFTYVGDAVVAIVRALGAASTDAPVFNIYTDKGTTVRALAENMARCTELGSPQITTRRARVRSGHRWATHAVPSSNSASGPKRRSPMGWR